MSYQHERDEFIARVTREGLPLWIAERLLREATGFQRRAELACSSEAADRDRVRCPAWLRYGRFIGTTSAKFPCLCDVSIEPGMDGDPTEAHNKIPRIVLQDWRAEQRCKKLLAEVNVKQGHYTGNETQKGLWHLLTAGDPRGYTMRIIPPSYAAENATRPDGDKRSIGVPAREPRLRF